MKEKIYAALTKMCYFYIITLLVFIICAMLAGPLMLGYNYSIGLIHDPLSYMNTLKIVIIFVISVMLIRILSTWRNSNG